jgi:FixJ family two-component response regulator
MAHIIDNATRHGELEACERSGLTCQSSGTPDKFVHLCLPQVASCLILRPHCDGVIDPQPPATLGSISDACIPMIALTDAVEHTVARLIAHRDDLHFMALPLDPAAQLDKVYLTPSTDASGLQSETDRCAVGRRFDELTDCERELVPLISIGLSDVEIADELGLSLNAVMDQRAHLMSKVRAVNSADLGRLAVISGRFDWV